MSQQVDSPLPNTRTYAGWGLNPALLAKSAGEWLKKKGYEVQSAASGDAHLVQARIVETGWKSWFAKCPSLDVRVGGGPDRLTVGFGDGTWGLDPSQVTVGHKVGGFLTAVWSGDAAHRRKAVESEFWAAVEAACRGCGILAAGARTGETEVGMSAVPGTEIDQGMLKGVQTYVENHRCTRCEAVWSGEEKRRTVSLCPGCRRSCKPAEVEETVIRSYKEREAAPGVFEGRLVYRRNFRCPGCSHAWAGPEASRKVHVCPACEQPTAGTEVRREVTGTVRREETRVAMTTHRHEPDKFGGRRSESITEYAVPVEYEVSVSVHRCEHCSHEWTGGQHERRLG